MAELMHFQPGKAFYDAFQGARGNTLAKLAITGEGEQRKSALADLYGLDPSLASQAQAQIGKNDEQDYSELVQSAKVMYSLKGRPEADMMWQRVAPKFSQKYGIQFNPTPQPSDWDAIEKIVQATDAGNKSMPTDVQSIKWKLESAGYRPGSAEYKKALDVELGITARPSSAAIAYKIVKGADGRERLIAVDPRTPGAMVMDGGTAGFGEPTATQEPKPSETDYNAIATNLQQVLRDAGFDDASARDVADAYHSRKSGEPKGQYTDGYVKPMPAGQSAAFVSRTPEEQAALTREAELKADLGLKPSIAAAESEAKFGVETRYAPGIAGASAEATAQGRARGERAATGEKKAAEAGDAIALLKEAEQILAGATGGYVGAKADEFAAAFGKSTKGAEANAQLNVIAPKLIGLVPRFEGPQSDADRKLYENAAGDLGNPNKPVSIRLAAARMMMKLYQKTADGKQSADGQTKRIRITL